VHDFEPGIKPSGLFWTVAIDPGAIDANVGNGAARFALSSPMPDFGDFFNAISPSPASTQGHVTFDVRWDGGGDRIRVRDSDFGVAGQFVSGPASITFAVTDASGAVYRADASGQYQPGDDGGPPGVGRERNGIFFDHDA
jgi:hypothetical protein